MANDVNEKEDDCNRIVPSGSLNCAIGLPEGGVIDVVNDFNVVDVRVCRLFEWGNDASQSLRRLPEDECFA